MKDNLEAYSRSNLLADAEKVDLHEFLDVYKQRIIHESEKLFLQEFLYPLLGKKGIKYIIPQYPFIDSEGKLRRIDFALIKDFKKIALEVNGETYHAEGVIPNQDFDDNLQRQNDILNDGWFLQRFSYNQLQSSEWRKRVHDSLRRIVYKYLPELLSEDFIKPHYLQKMALDALNFYRSKGWIKGIVVLPTGTGKTFLSAFDSLKFDGRILFIVHRLDILSQSKEAFEKVMPKAKLGYLTGEYKEHVKDSKVLFASKDTLRSPEYLSLFGPKEFSYIIVDEVHHGQAPTYHKIINHFRPTFMLGMTATPDRMDRKDIFELFDYNKVFEYTANEAIENGFLVPYSYYGLKDNIDYSRIRHNGQKYNTQDLDRYLIIERRNEQILMEYLEKGGGNKAIGFCCSINHANRMADFFSSRGIPSIAITSETEDRDNKIKLFRDNKYSIVFTVDLFNEGIDFPNVRVLMFLRPTESKTIFMQQLGRGLRLCCGKDRVIILDFIGNYKKANMIRKYLAKGVKELSNTKSGRIEKLLYQYTPNCEVHFDAEVEEILDNQDKEERAISKEDLVDAYYTLAETLGRKPIQDDINEKGEFKVSRYVTVYGSWIKFLREIGEFTEASYHYPQGVHLGHILYALKVFAKGKLKGTHFDEKFVRLRGELDSDRLGILQRQTKYKLQGLMEIGLIVDNRDYGLSEKYPLELTPEGKRMYDILSPLIDRNDLSFKEKKSDLPSWEMTLNPSDFNQQIWEYIKSKKTARDYITNLFLNTHAVSQMLNYLYRVERKKTIPKESIYSGFFNAPFVKMYCDQNGIDIATEEGAKHRCPFLLNMLEATGILTQERSKVTIEKFLVCKQIMKILPDDSDGTISNRIANIVQFLKKEKGKLDPIEESMLKETFGKSFLTGQFYLDKYEFLYE